jgi:hypothetical protein
VNEDANLTKEYESDTDSNYEPWESAASSQTKGSRKGKGTASSQVLEKNGAMMDRFIGFHGKNPFFEAGMDGTDELELENDDSWWWKYASEMFPNVLGGEEVNSRTHVNSYISA